MAIRKAFLRTTSSLPGSRKMNWFVGVALVLVAAFMLSCIFGDGGGSSGGKIMKAPGGNGRTMYRSNFESNPRGYFRDLHNK
ncbi:hypothetical protein K1719_022740 [Acacia pycnantha]|nr:hypothetical protein K1719_022740 [Acacia pycnantha]